MIRLTKIIGASRSVSRCAAAAGTISIATTRMLPTLSKHATAVSAVIATLLATSGGYDEKAFYLWSRGPISAACLRAHRTASTWCALPRR